MAKIQQVANPVYELTLDAEELKFLQAIVGESTGVQAKRILGENGILVQDALWDALDGVNV